VGRGKTEPKVSEEIEPTNLAWGKVAEGRGGKGLERKRRKGIWSQSCSERNASPDNKAKKMLKKKN